MEVQLKPYLVPKYATRLRIEVSVELGIKAFIRCLFYEDGAEFSPLHGETFVLEGDEYHKWGNDDNYIKQIVITKLGLQQSIF